MALQKITLSVEGMSCGHCSGMVKRTLEQIDGVSNVSVNLDTKKASFDASSSDLIDKAIQEVNEAGYRASSL